MTLKDCSLQLLPLPDGQDMHCCQACDFKLASARLGQLVRFSVPHAAFSSASQARGCTPLRFRPGPPGFTRVTQHRLYCRTMVTPRSG